MKQPTPERIMTVAFSIVIIIAILWAWSQPDSNQDAGTYHDCPSVESC